MHYADLDPKTAALLDFATDGDLFPKLQSMIKDGLDPNVFVVKRDGAHQFVVMVLGLVKDTDEITVAHEFPVAWSEISERVKLGVLAAYVGHLCDKHGRFVATMNPKLLALGVKPIS